MTRFGAVVRADSVRQLTGAGWAALVDYGVRTIVDLRRHDELAEDPPGEAPVSVVHVPLSGADENHAVQGVWRAPGEGHVAIRDAYVLMLERLGPRFARAVDAVGAAPAGCVVVHCYAGKDRTGLVCAMLLRMAGVSLEDIAADYALSGDNIRPLIDPWADAAMDEEERALRLRIGSSPPEVMREVLAELERNHGSVREYLLAEGASGHGLEQARERLFG